MNWLNNIIAYLLPLIPKSLIKIFARQYIAGETLPQALGKVKSLNAAGINATLDYLGEDPKTKAECLLAIDVYKKIVDKIHSLDLKSGISFKLSHMGLKLDKKFCSENVYSLIEYAGSKNVFARIDMEDISLKKDTLDIYLEMKNSFEQVGIVMQAYLRCGIEDAGIMISENANTRLCKGAYYWEDEQFVYKDMAQINSSYAYLMEKLMAGGCFTAIATHDEALVLEALKSIDKLNVSKQSYEFQMLYGVRERLRDIIRDQGHPIRVYVPFGKEWLAYCIRRIKENPKMVSYIFTNTLRKLSRK